MGKDAADFDEAVGKPGNREADKCGKGGEELNFDMRFDVQKRIHRHGFGAGLGFYTIPWSIRQKKKDKMNEKKIHLIDILR